MSKSLYRYLHLYDYAQVQNIETVDSAEQVSRYMLQRVCQAVDYRLDICGAPNRARMET